MGDEPQLVFTTSRALFYKWRTRVLCCVGAGLVLVEGGLRLGAGLGNPALVYMDNDFGYAFKPNQNVRRFGRRIAYDRFGLRSEPFGSKKEEVRRVMFVGDSVTNGGAPTDQEHTLPYQFRYRCLLRGQTVEALNASAGGWALENEFYFLQKNGIMSSDLVVLQVGTHDLWQQKAESRGIIGNADFPTERPFLAMWELWDRYLWPRMRNKFASKPGEGFVDVHRTEENRLLCLDWLRKTIRLVRAYNAEIMILLVPDREELADRHRSKIARESLLARAREDGVFVLDMLPLLSGSAGASSDLFRDQVHPSPLGNLYIAEAVASRICR